MARLINEETGAEIKVGDRVFSETKEYTLLSFTAPHKPSSTGRIYVEPANGEGMRREFFPSVVGAKIVEHEFDQ